jgi:hypothetical protein
MTESGDWTTNVRWGFSGMALTNHDSPPRFTTGTQNIGEKMKKSKPYVITLACVVSAFVATQRAGATQFIILRGTIGFSSAPDIPVGHVTQIDDVTTVTFDTTMLSVFVTQDYAGAAGQAVNFAPISWSGSGASAVIISSNAPEWSFTIGTKTYSFDLLHLTSASFQGGKHNFLALSGDGLASITGFGKTPAFFSLRGTGQGSAFIVLHASDTATVPDGESGLALFGSALIAVAGWRRALRGSP